ncbi:MAG: hypothetical protein KIS87_12755, partial [Phycisphaeraceae bacterium]|nr:hypothetical protein [Phycisphaeraceae bacterium]
TIQGGGACGWQYGNFVAAWSFPLAQLNATFHCPGAFGEQIYKFTANLPSGLSLNNGQNYMITIYATVSDPNHPCIFGWCGSTVNNYNPAVSWNLQSGSYDRCGPDNAFTLNPGGGGGGHTYCQKIACNTNSYFSNLGHNLNPYIVLDDWKPGASGAWTKLTFTGGGFDVNSWTGCDLSNIQSFLIEIYTAGPNGGFPCGWWVNSFLGSFNVPLASTNPVKDCLDIFNIQNYVFTVAVPAGFNVTAGTTYAIGVYAIPVDPNKPCIFAWGADTTVYGFRNFSFDTWSGVQAFCNDFDVAYCATVGKTCPVDCNGDTVVNTLDFICFLNFFTAGHPNADFNGDTVVNTLDFIAFLNAFVAGCP